MTEAIEKKRHFIRQIIEDDIAAGKHGSQVVTRFPPEPNGYLHLGHAKSICLNFSIAADYNGTCHLRFDDTNPIKEEQEYVEAIQDDIKWLGYEWGDNLFHASDYYEQFYNYAIELIEKGLAYIDDLTAEQMREYRGTLTEAGKESPNRNRPSTESLELFKRMRAGEFKDGEYVLRAKIDMSSGNLNLRDPILYRIRHAHHQRTGDTWCIYPMYDFAHSLSDAIEGISHSLCTLEFQDHRPLYDWCVNNVGVKHKPQQIEFARLNYSHTITSKRKLKYLVDEKLVDGWDDPRMPTLAGARHRGYPAAAIRNFCEMVGISKNDSIIDFSLLEECVRDELNQHAPRAMCVINPLKIVITNLPEDYDETLNVSNHPQNPEMGKRDTPFSQELYIERDDFMLDPPKKFFRLAPGKEVRLRSAYVMKCEEVIQDPTTGEVTELRCTIDKDTLGKNPEGRKVKGVIHWVSKAHALPVEVRLYDRLFNVENPGKEKNIKSVLNPNSLIVLNNCYAESSLKNAKPEQGYQFERLGYFCLDGKNTTTNNLVFNRIVSLRDSWAKK